jgi:Protein of unknown function (DUF2934)
VEEKMAHQVDTSRTDEIARVACAIWEAEGRPEGRDHEHWTKAQRLLDEGKAYMEYPAAEAGEAGGEQKASESGSGETTETRKLRRAKEKPGDDHSFVRPAGRKLMEDPPSSWSKTDEESDESFPASDPPGNY